MSLSSEVLLEMRNVSKSFPSVKALDKVSFTLKKGSVHALMGENGAGKSTLMKCLFGIYSADEGEMFLEGRRVEFKSPKEALENGVAMVHQELNQALKRNVMDNMWLGRYPKVFGFITSEKTMYDGTKKIFDGMGIDIDPRKVMSEMSVAQRQMAEIAKAVSYDSKVIVLDEPTSSLSGSEVEQLFKIIADLKSKGCGIIYISHKMEEILRISDEITVMRDGKHIATSPASEMDMNKIIKLMVGRELTNRFPPRHVGAGEIALEVKGITSAHNSVTDVSFNVRRGEIVGISGLDGSGRTELLENIFGISERKSGNIYLHGKEVKNRNARESIKNGFALLTEERSATGIFGILDIMENTVISSIKEYRSSFIALDHGKMRADTDKMIEAMRIKTPNRKTKIRTLSGGNQQKVILGRWLLTEPEVLLLDEPTRGIDVGAKYEIYQLIIDLAKKGKAVIMVSSEMPELLGVCSRILVMSDGKMAGEVDADNTSQEEIMRLATSNI
ncbi:MAG: ATP-binding cassette domain-containing protein [Clostridia bacterium]|nr:ATP-binding cassette domain-containing protein [Clostridia bacterium]